MSSASLRALYAGGVTLLSPLFAMAQDGSSALSLSPYTISPGAYSQRYGLADLGGLNAEGVPSSMLARATLDGGTLACGDVISVFSVLSAPRAPTSSSPLSALSAGASLSLSYELRIDAPSVARGAQLEPVRPPALTSDSQDDGDAVVRATGTSLRPELASLFEAESHSIRASVEGLEAGETLVIRHDLALRCESDRRPQGALSLSLSPLGGALVGPNGRQITEAELLMDSERGAVLSVERLESLRGARSPYPRLVVSLIDPGEACPSFEEARLSPASSYELTTPQALKLCYHVANTGGAPLEMSALTREEPSPSALELPPQLAPNSERNVSETLEFDATTWVSATLSGLPPSLSGALLSAQEQLLVRYVTAQDADGDGLSDSQELVIGTDIFSIDSDDDGLTDDREVALNSDPLDADTDDDGLLDGEEGSAEALHNHDSDGDGIFDGTERGVTEAHSDTDTTRGHFRPDLDPDTTSDHLSADTDGGGCSDREEDPNGNGRLDEGEASLTDAEDDLDRDEDGLCDVRERALGTDELDGDSDDDGVSDADERDPTIDVDGDGLTTPLDPDSDNDGLPDGLELGLTNPHPDTDVEAGYFFPDADPSTVTDPFNPDSDAGGTRDGDEDRNHNGAVDETESDPLWSEDDEPDPDGDLIPARYDLCPETYDPAQADLDGDGEGDECDEDDNGDGVYDGLTSARAQGCDQRSGELPPVTLIIVLGLVSLLSRRRRARERSAQTFYLSALLIGSATLVVSVSTLKAMPLNEDRNFSVDALELDPASTALPGGMSTTLPARPWGLSLTSAWLNRALIVSERGTEDEDLSELASLLDHRVSLTPALWVKVKPWLLLSASLPFSVYQGRDDLSASLPSPQISEPLDELTSTALGDLRLAGRFTHPLTEHISIASELGATLPTATVDAYMGELGVSPRARLALGYRAGRTRAGLTIGHELRTLTAILEQDREDLSSAQLSGAWEAMSALWLGLALQGHSDVLSRNPLRGGPHHATQLVAQVAYEGERCGVQLFGARRLYADLTSPDWQAGLRLSVSLDRPDWGALLKALTPRWVTARSERLKRQKAEEAQRAEEARRELARQRSPRDPDGDHILSEVDRCPEEAGDLLTEGCPRDDMDGDGVQNELDACMWTTGVTGNLGCPEGELAIPVELRKPFIFVFSAVELDPSQRDDLERLDRLALFLKARPSVQVHLSGHADYKGDEVTNLKVSKKRATYIMQALINRGVEPARLTFTAFGEQAPVVYHSEYEQRIKNRRVTLTFSLSEPTGARP